MKAILKQFLPQLGNVLSALVTLVLTIVAFSIYGANVGGPGYFHDSGVGSVVVVSSIVIVLEIIILAYTVVSTIFKMQGKTLLPELATKIVDTVLDVIKIIIPAILAIALFNLINARVQGLAFIFFSNEDVLVTIQTPNNMFSANTAITSFIMYAITILSGVVAAFFSITKKDKKVEASAETEAEAQA